MSLAPYPSRVGSSELLGRSPYGPSAYGFDVVAVGIKDERSIVVLSIVRTKPRLPITDSPCFQRRPIEGIYGRARICEKGHMQAVDRRPAVSDPEHRIRQHTEPYYFVPVRVFVALHQT
jgi:hypothetical protein